VKAEYSTFIFACIKARIEEFKSCKIVKIEAIKIEIRAKIELYQGRKKAIATAKIKIKIHKKKGTNSVQNKCSKQQCG